MKTLLLFSLTMAAFLFAAPARILAQGTAFTYHGQLADNGSPANGSYDLTFSVFAADAGVDQIGNTITNLALQVSAGLVSAILDFGPGIFTGQARWLEVGVRTNGALNFITLSPRQLLTPTPYAIMANTASNLLGTLPAVQLSGTLTDGQLPPGLAHLNNDVTFTGALTANSLTGNGSGLTALNASQVVTGTLADARLSSNVALLDAHQTFIGSNLFSGVVQLTDTDNTIVGNFTGNGSNLTALNPTNLAAGTAAIDISGNAASATSAATASAAPWTGLTGIPTGFVDGVDNDTLYSAGIGLSLNSTVFSVDFQGSGTADTAARSDHHHDSLYATLAHHHDTNYSLLGHAHAAADFTSGTLADERLSGNVALLNAHQIFSGSNLFLGVIQLSNTNNSFVGSFGGIGASLTGLNPTNLAPGTAAIDISGNAVTATTAGSATTATTATSAASFTGPLAGDVMGTQGATVVANVGGLSAANVASGVNLANAATSANSAESLVRRDSAGSFAAGVITATSYIGPGANLTELNATALASGTLADARLSSNVPLLNAHQNFSGSNLFSGVVQLTNRDNSFSGTFTGNGSSLAGLNPANLAAGIAAIDISGNAATATSAPWTGITGIPPGFADGLDQDTLYSAGIGLNLNGTEFSVSFGGSGVAGNAARSDHHHDGLYSPIAHNHDATYSLLGHEHAATDFTSGTLADERLSRNVALLNAHQTFSGSNTFSGVNTFTNATNTFVGTFAGDGVGLSNLVVIAGNVVGPISAEQLSGTLPSRLLAGSYTNALNFDNSANSYRGNGAWLSNVNAATLEGMRARDFWQLDGNADTIAGDDFLGTTDDQPLELKVNNIRALRLEPNASGAPNLIGGAPVNIVTDGVKGATIGGGGSASGMSSNSISSDFATIAGGSGNTIQPLTIAASPFASISGGLDNSINGASRSVIAGGANNLILSAQSSIGVTSINSASTISGGWSNSVGTPYSTIGGGMQNLISIDKYWSTNGTIAGGIANTIWGNHSAIGGGRFNIIRVTGGAPSEIYNNGDCTIGGGSFNLLKDSLGEPLKGATIAGGNGNIIAEIADYSFIGGGSNNLIGYYAAFSLIAGGANNRIASSYGARYSTIGGGSSNHVFGFASAISGGVSNTVHFSSSSTIGGGSQNSISSSAPDFSDSYGTVGGGRQNRINGAAFATIPGGENNAALGDHSLAAGRRAKANHNGALVWADSTDADFSSTAENQFNVRALGGVRLETGGAGLTIDGSPLIAGGVLAPGTVTGGAIVDGTVATEDLTEGAVTATKLATAAVNSVAIADGSISAVDLNPALLSDTFCQLGGNAGTTAGVDFLGTTDDQALELKVNNQRGLRLEPNTNGAPNVIGGAPWNAVTPGVFGAVIGGGGATNYLGTSYTNSISSHYSTIGGGLRNTIQAKADGSIIGGGFGNTIEAGAEYTSSSTISGGSQNLIQGGAGQSTIAGGYLNVIQTDASDATISGGDFNTIQTNADWSTISGGHEHTIHAGTKDSTIAGGYVNAVASGASGSSIGGGSSNLIGSVSSHSTIGGGYQNVMGNSTRATIGGGSGNEVFYSGASTIAGGVANSIGAGGGDCDTGTIGGGFGNLIGLSASEGTIGGGSQNRIEGFLGRFSTVSGGNQNSAFDSTAATIGGGSGNGITGGAYGMILGGRSNVVSGSYGFAAGRRANANHDGAFVWADSTDADFASTADNQFLIRASGGVGIGTDSPTTELHVNGTITAVALNPTSDRNVKEHFAAVDARAVLEKVANLQIESWNYKQHPGVRHIGPMAQDFYASFAVGSDDKHLATVDADGVALAAIQGLNQIVKEQQAALKQKEAEIQSLQQRLEALERAILGRETASNGGGR